MDNNVQILESTKMVYGGVIGSIFGVYNVSDKSKADMLFFIHIRADI